MKKSVFISMLFVLLSINSYATIRIITVQNYFFSPSPMVAYIGDTIKWQWVNGLHTTTAVTIPNLADSWDALIDGNNQTFLYVIQNPGPYNYHCSIHFNMGMTGIINVPVGIKKIETPVSGFELKQNYPNPFNPATTIQFSIPEKSHVSLKIFDITGKEINSLINMELGEGSYSIDFNGDELASGIYFYVLQTADFFNVKRMMLIK